MTANTVRIVIDDQSGLLAGMRGRSIIEGRLAS